MSSKVNKIFQRIEKYNKTYTDFNYSPFKLTFKLQSPIALAHPWIHLDGIIAHLLLRKILKNDYYILPTNFPLDFFDILMLPLKSSSIQNKKMYHSSISFFTYSNLFATTIYKRFDDTHIFLMKKRPKKVYKNSGKFRDYMMKLPYIPTRNVYFYGNGDILFLKELFKLLPGLGKKISIGYGFINSFKIIKIEQDYSILNDENITMRPIPLEFLKGNNNEKALLGYKFPYWGRQNICLCVPPGEKAELKKVIQIV